MKYCDCCEQEWEDEFFCDTCSHQIEGDWEEVPDPLWSGEPGGEYTYDYVEHDVGDICFNCCTCHLRKPQKQDNVEGGKTTNNSASLPF